jgi:transcriptional regulator with XRE-family HTH domain
MTTNHPSRSLPTRRGVLLPGLWAARVSAALSQRDLANMIGANQNTIQQLESRRRGAYPKTVRRLCQALGVEPADLMCIESKANTNKGDGNCAQDRGFL